VRTGSSIRSSRQLTIGGGIAAAVVVGIIAGLVLARSPQATPRPPAAAPARGPTGLVAVRRTRLGRILVDSNDRTLYLLTADRHGRSSCYGGCARVWPPALAPKRPHAGAGVTAAALTTTRRKRGDRQLVYHRHPLYTMVADKRAGEIKGQGYDGVWFVVAPSGRKVLKGAPKSAGGGY
jgi:predicted lipoprotein with Yx(FWY)xxD motif